MNEPIELTLDANKQYLIKIIDQKDTIVELAAYSQNDSRWANIEYAPGCTFARWGCLICSVAMILSMGGDNNSPNPVETARRLTEVGALNGGYLSKPSRIKNAFPNTSWGGVVHWRKISARIDIIEREILDYGATIIELAWNPFGPLPPGTKSEPNQHFAVATRMMQNDIEIIDPYTGERIMITESRYAKPRNWSVQRAIHGIRMVRPFTNNE